MKEMHSHAARFPGLTVGASAQALSEVNEERLFERSELRDDHFWQCRSSPGSEALIFSLVSFFCIKAKESTLLMRLLNLLLAHLHLLLDLPVMRLQRLCRPEPFLQPLESDKQRRYQEKQRQRTDNHTADSPRTE